MCVVNSQCELLESVFKFLYVDLHYSEFLSLFLLGLCAYVVCVVMWFYLICL